MKRCGKQTKSILLCRIVGPTSLKCLSFVAELAISFYQDLIEWETTYKSVMKLHKLALISSVNVFVQLDSLSL